MKESNGLARGSSSKGKVATSLSKAYKARSELLANLRNIQPTIATEIEKSDAINHEELNRAEEKLSRELADLDRYCDRLLIKFDVRVNTSSDPISESQFRWSDANGIDRTAVINSYIEDKLANAIQRRQEIIAALQQIRERRDAPLFVRMNAASELLRCGLDSYAADVLLDLISSGFYGLEQLISGDSDKVEFCLRQIESTHGTVWLDHLITSQPPGVANYMRLRDLLKESIR